jgi:hypothetical protein
LSPTIFALLGFTLLGTSRPPPSAQADPEPPRVNRCGCYEESAGICKCLRKSACGCPGECEPLGCEQRRQEDLGRRMQEELKKIRDEDRNRNQRREPSTGTDERSDEREGGSGGDQGRGRR